MFLTSKIRAVFSTVLTFSILSQPLFAYGVTENVEPTTTNALTLIKPKHAEAIYRHLVETHWTPKTGLFRSFPDSNDLKLSQQASTYEQAAMGLLCIRFGDIERANQLFQFLKNAWVAGPSYNSGTRRGVRGLVNFYNADFGTEGIEKTIHVGPNAWAGLFAAKLANTTKDQEALQWALDIQYWIANMIPHQRGGVAMGLRDDPLGASWSQIYSTENNLSYYAFLTELLRNPTLAKDIRVTITGERDRVENWLVKVAYDPGRKQMLRGTNIHGIDRMQVLDTITWLISAVGPKRLAARGINPDELMGKAQKAFEVSVGNAMGVDPTDQEEAKLTYAELNRQSSDANRPKGDNHRVIWYEGLGQYILAWSMLADYAEKTGRPEKAALYLKKVKTLTDAFDKAALSHYPRQSAYPYATPGMFFRFGWGAPEESDTGPASSLIAGIWRSFVGLGWDPMAGQDIATIQRIEITLPTDMHPAERRQAVLYGTSEDMTTEAWKSLRNQNWDHAIAQARATIQEWSKPALYLQGQKMKEVGNLVEYSGDTKEKQKIFNYWALNDVAASYFILGQALDHKGDYAKASQAFREIVNHYSLAQIWDPQGWFWSPVEAITNDYVLRDRKRYGWVLPQVVAEGSKTGKRPF